ncbi:hypothetical protein AB3662_16675 [Sorangium cellulosum]|uniref:hypothetical protein n=1 Tax=Sorangium cellulosum TaxID=56 RepID=UPI003D9A6911
MGCEDFLVRLSSDSTPQAAAHVLVGIPGICPDALVPALPTEVHFRYEDSEHIIEIEVAGAGPCTTLSLRFALCHPSSIDDVFAALVVDLVVALGADIIIAEDIDPDEPGLGLSFSSAQVADLRKALAQCIPKKRNLWREEFGSTLARASCRDALERFVIGASARPI